MEQVLDMVNFQRGEPVFLIAKPRLIFSGRRKALGYLDYGPIHAAKSF